MHCAAGCYLFICYYGNMADTWSISAGPTIKALATSEDQCTIPAWLLTTNQENSRRLCLHLFLYFEAELAVYIICCGYRFFTPRKLLGSRKSILYKGYCQYVSLFFSPKNILLDCSEVCILDRSGQVCVNQVQHNS